MCCGCALNYRSILAATLPALCAEALKHAPCTWAVHMPCAFSHQARVFCHYAHPVVHKASPCLAPHWTLTVSLHSAPCQTVGCNRYVSSTLGQGGGGGREISMRGNNQLLQISMRGNNQSLRQSQHQHGLHRCRNLRTMDSLIGWLVGSTQAGCMHCRHAHMGVVWYTTRILETSINQLGAARGKTPFKSSGGCKLVGRRRGNGSRVEWKEEESVLSIKEGMKARKRWLQKTAPTHRQNPD